MSALLLMMAGVFGMADRNAVNAADDTIKAEFYGTYHQTEARKQLDMINAFRTSGNAWYWNSDNTQKISVGKLPALTYDYALEKVAMQRAAELAVRYSHTRPDGSEPWTAYGEQGYSSSYNFENIAYGFFSSQEVFAAWREDDKNYAGQGHRRNMLGLYGGEFCATAFGAACVEYDGVLYWVEEFSDTVNSSVKTAANDSETLLRVNISAGRVNGWKMDPESIEVDCKASGKISDLAKVTFSFGGSYIPYTGKALSWTSDDTSIVSVSGESYKAEKFGETVLRAEVPGGKEVTLKVRVRSSYAAAEWNWDDVENDNVYVTLRDTTGSGKPVTLKATITKKGIRMPGCVTEGLYSVTAEAEYEGETYTDTYEEPIPATGHVWQNPEYSWADDNRRCTGRMTCRNNPAHEKIESTIARVTDSQAPNCEAAGYMTYTAVFQSDPLFTAQTKTVELPALGHSWVNSHYVWSRDLSECTGVARCTRCHDEWKVTVETTSKITKQATYEQDGYRTYTASFEGINGPFYTQTKTQFIPRLEPVYMYRLYNPNSGEHFYTSDEKEMNALVNVHRWTLEGIGWLAPETSNTPVYRLYNKTGGEHHYTTDKKERDALINKHGWKDEGIGWYSDDNQKVIVFREYNPNAFANNHNYTPDTKEHNALINKYGWKDEGIAWYAISGRK